MSNLDGILSQLNPHQQEAVVYNQGPLLILAGAGSGKTRALIYKVVYLIKATGVDPDKILLVTFTNKAAEEMKKRIKALLGPGTDSSISTLPWTGTFHSFCARLLRKEGKYLGLPAGFSIFDEQDQLQTVKQAMVKLDISPKKFNPASVLATISQAKNELITPSEYQQYVRGPFQKTVAGIFVIYQKMLREYNALDFDDLLLEAVRLLETEKKVLTFYQDKFHYLLVDEYQDTNRAQYRLTKLLSKKYRRLCVVGDASQSIYSWRGANYRNILNLRSDYTDLKIINFEQNYRSTKTILQAANEVIKKNTSHPILKLWTEKREGEKITLYHAADELDEALFTVNTIQSLTLDGNRSFDQFAILYRTNAQSRVIEETLLRSGLPYVLVGGTRFYERKEIKDCLAYLRLLANPADLISHQRIEKLGKKRLEKFQELVKQLKMSELVTIQILDKILAAVSYLESYDRQREEDLSRIENIQELRSVATQFPNLNDFLENVALIQKESLPKNKSQPISSKGLTLMTMHAAKGTEFPVVFILGMEEGLFPHSRSLLDKEGLEEERRLYYVGITRAKERLYLTYAHRRLYFGQRLNNPVSRFIKDIPVDLVDSPEDDFVSDTI
ncbi:MAG TPA: UvrD-helicase domain-containing protein [Candidatus Bathyarchaeia archaeon]|nr:UvrD-helicase domain-containing protein [Candidatus Bathyarchaeia archaeon]